MDSEPVSNVFEINWSLCFKESQSRFWWLSDGLILLLIVCFCLSFKVAWLLNILTLLFSTLGIPLSTLGLYPVIDIFGLEVKLSDYTDSEGRTCLVLLKISSVHSGFSSWIFRSFFVGLGDISTDWCKIVGGTFLLVYVYYFSTAILAFFSEEIYEDAPSIFSGKMLISVRVFPLICLFWENWGWILRFYGLFLAWGTMLWCFRKSNVLTVIGFGEVCKVARLLSLSDIVGEFSLFLARYFNYFLYFLRFCLISSEDASWSSVFSSSSITRASLFFSYSCIFGKLLISIIWL